MAADSGRQEAYPEHQLLRQHLAATVTKMQWSYAIFWSNSTRQQGVLAWRDGYYNGDIKTRKTTQPMEFQDDDPMGLQRSEQLRELYVSLSAGDSSNQQSARRPCASLTPEDLTDTEWYYLVCMSFTFTPGQCLPGRALMNNQHIWLTDAHFADTRIFTRSLLAKSASIQTVVCFPFKDGIIELGTTELVLEHPATVQQIKTSLLEAPASACSELCMFSSSPGDRDDDTICQNLDHDMVESVILGNHDAATAASQAPMENVRLSCLPFALQSFASNEQSNGIEVTDMNMSMCKKLDAASSGDGSRERRAVRTNADSSLIEGLNDMPRVQMRDGDSRTSMYGSLSTNNFVSASFVNPQRLLLQHSSPATSDGINEIAIIDGLQELQDYTTSLDLEGDDSSHYTKAIATVLRQTHQPPPFPCFPEVIRRRSSFTVWNRDARVAKPFTPTPQRLLKNIFTYAARMCASQRANVSEEDGRREKAWASEGDDAGMNHVMSERKRREKLNEKFLVLRTIVPSISKVDKASVLGDTIEYLKGLETRVEELESCRDFMELEVRGRRKHHPDVAERTSDNYGSEDMRNAKKPCANKRKLCNIIDHGADAKYRWISDEDGHADVNVTVIDEVALIDMQCPWRDCLLMEVVESMSDLHLDPFSMQSSTVDGIVKLSIKSKFMESAVASPGMIKRALQRVAAKY